MRFLKTLRYIVTSPFYRIFSKPFTPKYEKPEFSFVVLSDIHMCDLDNYRKPRFAKALKEINTAKHLDAVVTTGDNTDHGYEYHWKLLAEDFAILNCKNRIITMGNHDNWSKAEVHGEGYSTAVKYFAKYNKIITDNDCDKVYYRKTINGYIFLVVGSEGDDGIGAVISDAQLKWLDNELKNADKNKPIFVLSHFAINKSHGLPKTFGDKKYTDLTGGFGYRSDDVNAILQKYDNVILFSGHSHMGLCKKKAFSSFEKVGNIYSYNLPCFMFPNHDGIADWGIGLVVEVYEDKILFRPRNLLEKVWYKKYEEQIVR